MSKIRLRKFQRELIAHARSLGVESVSLEFSGRHPKIVGVVSGRALSVICYAGTPKEWHALDNAKKSIEKACDALRRVAQMHQQRKSASGSDLLPCVGRRPMA